MRPCSLLFIGITIAALGVATLPRDADAATQRSRAPATRPIPAGGFDMTMKGPSVAMQAAQATQAASRPGGAIAQPGAAQPVETPTSAPEGTVAGITVSPEVRRQGRVIASTNATSLTSPNFSAADAEQAPMAIAIAPGTALGQRRVENRVAVNAGGLLGTNPELLGIEPTRGTIGVSSVF